MTKPKFSPKSENFSYENALFLAEASDIAYQDPENIYVKTKGEWGFDRCEFRENNDTQFFMAQNKEMVLLAFRGTETKKIMDILADIWAFRKKIFWGCADEGFYNALDFVFKDIAELIGEMQDNNQPIWITGHSLGGALATLAAARLIHDEQNESIQGVYTYGQPRVGDKEFKVMIDKELPGKFYRLTNYLDPVSLVPFKLWKYRHVGKIVLFDEQGERVERVSLTTRISIIVVLLVLSAIVLIQKNKDFCKKLLASLLGNHSLSLYEKNIEKNMKG